MNLVIELFILLFLFIIGGTIADRILYVLLHLEGALLATMLLLYTVGAYERPWYMLIFLVIAAVGARVALALVVAGSRSIGHDHLSGNDDN